MFVQKPYSIKSRKKMKKITLMAALLGSAYFANAQVGINTDAPKTSAFLDVEATDKGILIPRVALTSTDEFTPIIGEQVESLLVYNTATAGTGDKAVVPGFYYWKAEDSGVVAHWERVVNQAHLEEVISNITNITGNLDEILALLRKAYPSNNLDGTPTTEKGGGMVFTPADGATPAIISYVHYDAATKTYITTDITGAITDLIGEAESKTLIVNNTSNKAQYYISETYLSANGGVVPAQSVIDGWTAANAPAGVYPIDVIGGVVNNFQEILNENITIGGNTTTIEEYIQNISKDGMQEGVTKIVINNNEATFQTWNETTKQWVNVDNSVFEKIVTDNETVTTLTKEGTTGAVGDEIKYTYVSEDDTTTVITLTADVLNSITNNETIKNAITNITNAGGNVYFGDHDNDASTPNVFYTIDASGNKTPIDISSTVVNAIINASETQINEIKNVLGDTYSETTIVNTGDTWIDGGKVHKGVYSATILKGTARLETAINLNAPTGKTGNVIGITILDTNGNIINVATTDVDVDKTGTGSLSFKIGTGNMYSVLDTASNKNIKVMVEFSVTK